MLKNVIVLPDGTELSSGIDKTNALQGVTITECVNSGTELTIGSVCSGMLEATLIVPGGNLTIAAGTEVTLYKEDESGARTKVGLYTLENPTRSSANTYKITAYDRISWLDKDLTAWLAGLDAWPYTLFNFAGIVCLACGLTLANDSLPNGDFPIWKFSADGITGRQLMTWIGEATAKFCKATPGGEIVFTWYQEAEASVSPTGAGSTSYYYYQNSLVYEDYQVAPIEKVQIQYSDNDVGVIWPNDVAAANTYKVTGNQLLTTDTTDRLLPIVQTIYNVLKDVTYTPGKVSIPANLVIHAGDIVTATDANGVQIQMYVMSRTQSGQKDTLESTGSRRRDSVSLTNQQRYEALSGKVLNLQTSVEGIRAENASTDGRISVIEQNVDDIGLSVSRDSSDIEGIKEQIAQINVNAENVGIRVSKIETDGVDKVKTSMGYTFDDDGLHISKSGEEIDNTLDHTGMYVKRGDEIMLKANKDGVVATDVTVRNYLIIGSHARFEDYSDGTDGNRTACFYV